VFQRVLREKDQSAWLDLRSPSNAQKKFLPIQDEQRQPVTGENHGSIKQRFISRSQHTEDLGTCHASNTVKGQRRIQMTERIGGDGIRAHHHKRKSQSLPPRRRPKIQAEVKGSQKQKTPAA